MEQESYYGAPSQVNSSKTLGERLRDLYAAEDFVEVMNIDTKPLTYQFTSPSDTETFGGVEGEKNTIVHRNPRRFILQPGDRRLCPAYEADLMLECLIKQVAMGNIERKISTGEQKIGTTVDWTDPVLQDTILNKAIIGKRDVLNMYNEPKPSVEDDLNINDTTAKPRVGRPPKTA